MLALMGITLHCSHVGNCAMFFSHLFEVDLVEDQGHVQINIEGVVLHLVPRTECPDSLGASPSTVLQLQLAAAERIGDFFNKLKFFFYTHPLIVEHLPLPHLEQRGNLTVICLQDPSGAHWEIVSSSTSG